MAPRAPKRPEFARALAGLERSLLSAEHKVPAADRQAAAGPDKGAGAMGEYLDRVRKAADSVTDEEVAELRRHGHSDDEIFELTVCAAFGASRRRLDAGLAAIAAAYEEKD